VLFPGQPDVDRLAGPMRQLAALDRAADLTCEGDPHDDRPSPGATRAGLPSSPESYDPDDEP